MLVYFFRVEKLSPPLQEYSQLELMLTLRKLGHSYTVLADHFKVPKTTIRYLCRRFGLHERTVITTVVRAPTTTSTPRIIYDEHEGVINQGKSYADYIHEEQQRKWRRLTKSHSV